LAGWPRQAVSIYGALPPRNLGELLSESFTVYSRNFVPFFALALIAAAPSILGALTEGSSRVVLFIVGLLFSRCVYTSITWAVAQQYIGRSVTVGQCLSVALKHLGTIVVAGILAFLIVAGSAVLILLIIGIYFFFYFLVSLFFTTEAIVIDRTSATGAISRSINLVRGSWWRVLGIGIVFVLATGLITLVLQIPAAIIGVANETTGEVISAAVASVVAPIIPIGRTLLYLDLRVRKENLTLDRLAVEMGPAPA